ncbi:MAG: cache domain-containing protein [Azoarcus sp.]|jgi:signal transduction histidine kinase/CheY-like chemotaxis protein/HPt (histidine-containing phosphotransfer) domain-containing protein|nr:cache domain-containing protein [Azoarcus sp.]
MRALSLKSKIIIPIVMVFIFLFLMLTFYSKAQHVRHVEDLFDEKISVTANVLKEYLNICAFSSKLAAISMSTNPEVKAAIKKHDKKEIIKILSATKELYRVDYYTVTDASGIVLARTHNPEKFGDSVLGQQNVKNALEGEVSTFFEEGTVVKVSVRTGSPVYDKDGTLLGVISSGVRLDTTESVEKFKKYFGLDFTVFFDDKRISTTISLNENRVVGTLLNPEISKVVLEQKNEYYGKINIMGENYNMLYLPLINAKNEVFAVISVGISNSQLLMRENVLMNRELIIGLGCGALFVLILLGLITKITKPISKLTFLVSEASRGNLNVDIDRANIKKDEIGDLILDVYTFIGVIKSLMKDLADLSHELKIFKKPVYRIDLSRYKGSYKKIAEDVQSLTEHIVTMNEVMTVMDSLNSMINVVDFDYNIVYINSNMANTYGVDRDNCRGKKCYKVFKNLDQPCSICQMPMLFQKESLFPSCEYEFLYDEHLGKWFGGRASIMRWIDGSFVYFQSLNDETDKKKNQEKLNNALKATENALSAKSTFFANMSHELRTPLNIIVGISNMELENNKLSETVRENFDKVRLSATTLLRIVNDILDISKIDSGNFILTHTRYHVASLLNDTLAIVASYIKGKQIIFNLNINEDLPSTLYGDDLRVKQIFNNLLSNAIKYTEAGSIELGVHCVREGDDDVWMEIAVKDTGIGIHPEDLKKLFSDYSQVDDRASRKMHGTGLGLSITKKLAENMGGTVSVESEYGKGSTFCVRIRQGFVTDVPIGSQIVENLRKFHYAKNKHYSDNVFIRDDLSYAKVLLVDDLPANLEIAASLMRKYKMQVDCVTSGQSAIKRIKLGEPVYDAIFMDHMMPEMDGIEAADKIRAIGTDYARTIPIIALTANAIVGTEELFYKHDFQAFITKPIDIMRLDSVIQQWVKNESGVESSDKQIISDMIAINSSQAEEKFEIEISGIDAENGLFNCGGDHNIYVSVLRSYVVSVSEILNKIHDVTQETLPNYIIVVHAIKGSSATIGAEAIRETAANLEEMARKGDLSGVLAKNDTFLQETECLLAAIKGWLDSRVDKIEKPQLPAPDRALLIRLCQSCKEYDLNGVEKIMEELNSANYETDADLVVWLREKVDSCDFFEIIEKLEDYENKQKDADAN